MYYKKLSQAQILNYETRFLNFSWRAAPSILFLENLLQQIIRAHSLDDNIRKIFSLFWTRYQRGPLSWLLLWYFNDWLKWLILFWSFAVNRLLPLMQRLIKCRILVNLSPLCLFQKLVSSETFSKWNSHWECSSTIRNAFIWSFWIKLFKHNNKDIYIVNFYVSFRL